MSSNLGERFQSFCDLIEKHQTKAFLGAAAFVALLTSWGL